jgi:diguanylate cyclase (GGDEF)-like protein/PAS domain S-box-containing protein
MIRAVGKTFGAIPYRQALQNIQDGVYIVDPERRILFWNSGAERISGCSADRIAGSFCFDNILRHVDDTGRLLCHTECPLAAALADGRDRQADLYLHHRDGHRVPIHVRISVIRDGKGAVTGAVETFSENRAEREIRERVAELERLAMLDALTGIANRRYLDGRIEARLSEANRYGWPFGLAILDIDDFKRINDTYGHDVGDRVLRLVASTLLANVRPFDDVGRWGGEEFLVLAANAGGPAAFHLVDRLRALVAASSLDLEETRVVVTVSAGLSEMARGDSGISLLKRADDGLYASKKAGKNLVTLG